MNRQNFPSKTSHLLVEGKDDFHVVSAICSKYNVPETFELVSCEGINNLFSQIPIFVKLKDQRLGILLDTDLDLLSRWQQLINLLAPLGYNISDTPDPEGSILHSPTNSSILGIWLMPDNKTSGTIEDFARLLIPVNDVLLHYAERVLSDIGSAGLTKFKDAQRSKALIHTWLAWQEAPGTPMGQAISKSYLDHNQDLCVNFVKWLSRLFVQL